LPEASIATRPDLRGRRHPLERGIVALLFLAGAASIAVTIGILWELGKESLLFFQDEQVGFWDFLTDTSWLPQAGRFGVWPLVLGTTLITVVALIVAVPIGLASAIYLSEYASRRARNIIKPTLEVLVGIPTVVFGFFAVTVMTPLLRSVFGANRVGFFNVLSAGIVVGILIVPLISSLAEDAMAAVPGSLRQAAYALGASRFEVATRIVFPAALSGIAAGVVIAMSRAVGETMVVTLAAGASPRNFIWSDPGAMLDPFSGAQTMTGYIAITASGDLSYDTVDYNSIFAIGLALFVMTLVLNSLSRRIVKRYRQVYE
jgi:phosphate transport system permease protein